MTVHEEVSKYMSKLGKKGGTTRGKNHSKEQLSAWAKKGGRPKTKKVDAKPKE